MTPAPRQGAPYDPEEALRAALDVDPSPEFLAKVRTRIAAEPEPRRWRLVWMVMPASAVVVLAAVLLWPRPEPSATIAEEITQPVVVPVQEPVPVPVPVAAVPPARPRPRVARERAPVAIVVNTAERDAFERLVARIEMGDLPSDETMAEPLVMPLEIEFAPVTIAPIAFATGAEEEGERQ